MNNILKGINYEVLNFYKDYEYSEIEYDSRKINKNDIFVALKGFSVDGHKFLEQAIKNGAKLLIVSEDIEIENNEINIVKIEDTRKFLGKIASNFYNFPQDKLKIVGVTGTNGKTTTTYLLEAILGKVARLGTIEYKIGDEVIPAINTTPESLDIIKMCKMTVDKCIDTLVMEVSSHALELGRVDMLEFDVAIFTNLTQDHLDFHGNLDNYYEAKLKLFDKVKDDGIIISNIDNKWGEGIHKKYKKTLSYSLSSGDIKGEIIEYTNHNMKVKFEYSGKEYIFYTSLMGEFNLYNMLGAFGGGIGIGKSPEEVIESLSNAHVVPGRFETINEGQNFMTIVDYAHTDDGLKNILSALEKLKKNNIITVFGAGGDRDRKKRPKMAKAAAQFSDFIIITSDNPRTEKIEQILSDVEQGVTDMNYPPEKYIVIENREEAIAYAIKKAEKDSIVLIAGKGHEDYQIIGQKKIHFDDREMVRKYIAKL